MERGRGLLRRCGVLLVGGFLRGGFFAGFVEDLDLLRWQFGLVDVIE